MQTSTFYLVVVLLLVTLLIAISRGAKTLESYFVYDRDMSATKGSLALTAAWTQPLALFASGVFAYMGLWQFLAFAVPNVIAISLPALAGPVMRKMNKKGYTLPEVFERVFEGFLGKAIRTVFALFACVSIAFTMALNLTMLQQVNPAFLHLWTGTYLGMTPPTLLTVLLGLLAYLWAMPKGIRGAVRGDISKEFFIFCGAVGILVLWFAHPVSQTASAVAVPEVSPWMVFWQFGIPFSVSLLPAPLSNPDMVERIYAIREKDLVRASLWSVVLFTLTILAYGSLGFLARQLGLQIAKGGLPAVEIVKSLPLVAPAVSVIVMVTLTSSLASALASSGNLLGVELVKRFALADSDREVIYRSRMLMLLTLAGGFAMAFYVNNIAVLLQNMSVVRGEQLVAIFVVLFWPRAVPSFAVLVGVVGGVVASAYTTFVVGDKTLGACVAVLVPLACCLLGAWHAAYLRRALPSRA